MEAITQSATIRVPLKAYLSTDHVTAATGKTIAIVISKNGAAFGNPSGGATNAVEIASGWYYVDLSTTDTGTLGPLVVRGTSTGVDDVEIPYHVVAAGSTAPTASAVATAVWQDLLASSDFSTAASIGALLKLDIDAAISSRAATASIPTATQVATAVWQDLLASSDFGTASSIGALLKVDMDAAISSRMATFTLPTNFSSFSIDANGRVKALVDVQKNVALAHFTFILTDSTAHAPLTGKINANFLLKQERIDAGAAAALSGTITEVDSINLPGVYDISLTAGEVNGKVVTLYFQTADSDPAVVTLVTSD